MLRRVVAFGAALVPLCLPVVGGGSDISGQARSARHEPAAELPAVPAEVAPAAISTGLRYPTFLRPLPGEPLPLTDGNGPPVRELLISFDDGPDLFHTPSVLETLDRFRVKAIFFVNGRYLLGSRPQDLARRDLLRKVAARGHLVANHSLTHRDLCREPDAMAEEIDANAEIIAYATGLRPALFRAPYGTRCRALDTALRARDLVQVGWNLDPQDWKAEGEDALFTYVTHNLGRLRGRAILLLHDSQVAAVRALPRILRWIEAQNHRTARDGGVPLRIVDYSVFLPERPVAATGLEPLAIRMWEGIGLLPGVPWAVR